MREVLNKAAEVSADFSKTISATLMSNREFRDAMKKKEMFVMEIIEQGVVLYGKKIS